MSATLLVFGTCRYCLCGPASTCRTLAITACAVPQCGLQAERDFNDLVESVEAKQLGTGLNDGGQISSWCKSAMLTVILAEHVDKRPTGLTCMRSMTLQKSASVWKHFCTKLVDNVTYELLIAAILMLASWAHAQTVYCNYLWLSWECTLYSRIWSDIWYPYKAPKHRQGYIYYCTTLQTQPRSISSKD